jgi:hypothetical protein
MILTARFCRRSSMMTSRPSTSGMRRSTITRSWLAACYTANPSRLLPASVTA